MKQSVQLMTEKTDVVRAHHVEVEMGRQAHMKITKILAKAWYWYKHIEITGAR